MDNILNKKTLFWDIDTLDLKKNRDFIILRILSFGDIEDFKWAAAFYGLPHIKRIVKNNAQLDRKSLYFWCYFFNINKSKCIKRQSTRKLSAFWKRLDKR